MRSPTFEHRGDVFTFVEPRDLADPPEIYQPTCVLWLHGEPRVALVCKEPVDDPPPPGLRGTARVRPVAGACWCHGRWWPEALCDRRVGWNEPIGTYLTPAAVRRVMSDAVRRARSDAQLKPPQPAA